MSALDDEVARLTASGEGEALADALVRRATERLGAGRFGEAARDLADAGVLHRVSGRRELEARVTVALATALRANGEIAEAAARAEAAIALTDAGTPLRVSAETELGEDRLLEGRGEDAVAAYRRALGDGAKAGLVPVAQAALHRRIAMAASIAGKHEQAAIASREASRLYAMAGRGADSTAAKIEAASALVAAGLAGPAAKAIAEARSDSTTRGDRAALADLALLDSAQALAAGDAETALARAREARVHAREGDSVLAYVGAAIAIAELLDASNDRAGAYDSLAVGWVTAADQIGQDAAAALFRPKLADLASRWGAPAFEQVKDAYYADKRRN